MRKNPNQKARQLAPLIKKGQNKKGLGVKRGCCGEKKLTCAEGIVWGATGSDKGHGGRGLERAEEAFDNEEVADLGKKGKRIKLLVGKACIHSAHRLNGANHHRMKSEPKKPEGKRKGRESA